MPGDRSAGSQHRHTCLEVNCAVLGSGVHPHLEAVCHPTNRPELDIRRFDVGSRGSSGMLYRIHGRASSRMVLPGAAPGRNTRLSTLQTFEESIVRPEGSIDGNTPRRQASFRLCARAAAGVRRAQPGLPPLGSRRPHHSRSGPHGIRREPSGSGRRYRPAPPFIRGVLLRDGRRGRGRDRRRSLRSSSRRLRRRSGRQPSPLAQSRHRRSRVGRHDGATTQAWIRRRHLLRRPWRRHVADRSRPT